MKWIAPIILLIPTGYDVGLTREYEASCVECNHYRQGEPDCTAILLWNWVMVKDEGICQHVMSWFWAPSRPIWRFPHHSPLIVRDERGRIWKIWGTMLETWSLTDRERDDNREWSERCWFPRLRMTGARR